MADTLRPYAARCPPPRQARGTLLNTIMEDTRESQFVEKAITSTQQQKPALASPKLTLKTTGLSLPTHHRIAKLLSPSSAVSSCCSDVDWQQQMRGFDDLYDVTDEEDMYDDDSTEIVSSCFSPGTRPSSLVTPITRNSYTSTGSRRRSLTLEIPSPTCWPSMNGTHKSSPVPPTPPPKIPVSPAALSMLGHSVPASYAPPSLDGSLSSDQDSHTSGLATPDTQSLPDASWDIRDIHVRPYVDGSDNGDLEEENSEIQDIPITIESSEEVDWRSVLGSFPQIPAALQNSRYEDLSREPTPSNDGVFLPDGALAMLHHIQLDGAPGTYSETSEDNGEMRQLLAPPSRPRSADGVTPASEMSGYSFSELSIPSPGGFFASLAPRARHTWSIPNTSNMPPSSAMAERFYNLPWRQDEGEVVEQVIEWPQRPEDEDPLTAVRDEQGPPTAIRIPCETPTRTVTHQDSPMSATFDAVQEIPQSATIQEYDDSYDLDLQQRAAASLDRTSIWLAAQSTYMSALNETNPVNEVDTEASTDVEEELPSISQPKKEVRFDEGTPQVLSPLPPMLASKDSIYWRGFQSIRERADIPDGFLHRNVRYDAVQSFRLGLVDNHINCLTGKYELVLPERPAYKGPFSKAPRNSTITGELAEKAQFSKLGKEQLVLAQLCEPMWAMEALRSLNGNKLLTSPASRRLALTNKPSKAQQKPGRQIRILDLGGQATCEWAWHVAHEYPNVRVYSVNNKKQATNSGIKGPSNHRVISVTDLWKLPFGANKFDVITTRSLHALLKTECPVGFDRDEYDLVLQECLRCLKPGGFLEYMVLDAGISRAGEQSTAASAEFASSLRNHGYDPAASKSFLARLRNTGFVGIKRAWMFLPMGMEPVEAQPPRETPPPRVQSGVEEYEAVHGPVGSTGDIASITGLLGGWMWEQWLIQFRMEMGLERGKLLEGVGAIFDEGRKNGAGWTCLSGWAMKPKPVKQMEQISRF
ncbi:Methyltransferase type 11 [Penicillium angulare]|uniref:Methyltransferase type 11 n=1 Tax=Penicillium angulare TaxID=116970 RepID=A0A9W9EG23_9EURO|nr:Methyltransferase type 11 [Penicillium angulare]